MWGLIIASGVCGLLLGRSFKIFALTSPALAITGIACVLASQQGLVLGVLALVLAVVSLQLCYVLSGVTTFTVLPTSAASRA